MRTPSASRRTTRATSATRERPWLASYPPGAPESLQPYAEQSLFTLLTDAVDRFARNPAVAFFGNHITYQDLLKEVEQFSRALASLGVKKGDRVGYVLPNCPQYLIAYFATLRLGATAVGNNPLYTPRELSHQLKDAGIEVVVTLDQLYPLVAAVKDEVGLKTIIVTKLTDYMKFPLSVLAPLKFRRDAKSEGRAWPPVPAEAKVLWWPELMKGKYEDVPVADVDAKEDVAALVYTGGTTGLSKGAMLTHYNMLSNLKQTASWFTDAEAGKEAMMCVLPFFHSYGLQAVMGVGMHLAGKLILLPRFELEMALKAVAKEKPTFFPGVPRIYIAINESPETKKYDLASIRACLSGAAPLPVAVAEKFQEITGARVREGYGLTETSPVTHINPIYGKAKEGSIGLPMPDTDCKIVDLDDPNKELPQGEEGELAVAGPQIMKGYFNSPEATDDMIKTDKNGVRWLYTGDIAKMDEEGYFSIVDRKKDMILVSGFNVYPNEVESVAAAHPGVLEAAAVAQPDERSGEVVALFVVRKDPNLTEKDVIDHTRKSLTGYKVPKRVYFKTELPKTNVGKILRRALREEIPKV
ncbi:MAG: long-chain-fatty-acid--CoA ligase [Actinomycetota bacterium]